jgi:hypothetical protein
MSTGSSTLLPPLLPSTPTDPHQPLHPLRPPTPSESDDPAPIDPCQAPGKANGHAIQAPPAPSQPASSGGKASYGSIRTGILRITPESMKCKLYCRGSACKYCSHVGWTPGQQALKGLYSSWIGDTGIVAMARPVEASFREHSLMEQLHAEGVRTVINLQVVGEHAFCGQGSLLQVGGVF